MNQITDLVERGHDVLIYSFNSPKLKFVHRTFERYKLVDRTTYYKHPSGSRLKKLWWFASFFVINFGTLFHELGLKIVGPGSTRSAIHRLSLSQSVAKYLNESNADIVHAHFGQRGAIVANLIAKGKVRKFKFITTFHGYDLNPLSVERYRVAYKNIFRFADAITVNTEYLRKIVLDVCPKAKNLVILPVGLRTEQYKKELSEPGPAKSSFRILFCGRLVGFKAPDLAVQIMNILVNIRHYKNLQLIIAGDGRLRKYVESLIDELGLRDYVFLRGALSQEQVVHEMSNADVFLLPGIHEKETGRAETQGLVIQEAQAMGLPVVVSDAGGIKYGLLDKISGFVVREGDLQGFADKIEFLMHDQDLRKKMGEAGRELVVLTYDIRILGGKLLQLYSSL